MLAFTALELAGAAACSAKVEPERRDIGGLQSTRGAKHDFVVQRTAAGRQGVADDGNRGRILQLSIKRFQPASRTINVDLA